MKHLRSITCHTAAMAALAGLVLLSAPPARSANPPLLDAAPAAADFPLVPMPSFAPWPVPPPSTGTTAAAAATLRPSPSVMTDAMKDKKLYSFRAEDLDIKAALSLFARANNLNIVPDLEVAGKVTLDVRDLTLDRIMQALLEAHDVSWTNEQGLIRVHATETRMFEVDYLRLTRKGMGSSSATLSSASSGSGSGGSGGGLAGGGGGIGGASGGMGGSGSGGSGGGSGGSVGGSSVNLTAENPIDFWKELQEQIEKQLTVRGKETLAIDKTAGIIQITDRPSVVRKVAHFIERLSSSIVRQVDIEAKLYDVTLGDQFQFGIDWAQIATAYGGKMAFVASPSVVSPSGGVALKDAAFSILFSNKNTSTILTALREQGDVTVLSQPRLRTLNNQTALIKVGTDTPFFSHNTTIVPSGSGNTFALAEATYQVITVGTILSLTPRISSNDWITIDVSPVITGLVETRESKSTDSEGNTTVTTAPVLDIKQASTIIRLRDGETIVLGGLIQNSTAITKRKIPWIGDIPYVGKLFQGTFESKQKKELVIFLTPTVVR